MISGATRTTALVAVLLVVGLAGCGERQAPQSLGGSTGAAEQPGVKKRILAAVSSELTTLSDTLQFNNAGAQQAGVSELEQIVHAGLSIVDDHGHRVPRLGEAVPSLENGLWTLF